MIIQRMQNFRAQPSALEGTWTELVTWLTDVERTSKAKGDLPCWAPCSLSAQRRVAANVTSVSCLVLDFDDLTVAQWEDAKQRLEGVSYCYHSTYSFQPVSGALCYRVIVELDKPVPGARWKAFFGLASEMLGGANDEKCSDASRLFFAPFCPTDGPEPQSGRGEGFALPTDEILAQLPTSGAAQAPPSSSALTHARIIASLPKSIEKIENDAVRTGWRGVQLALDGLPFAAKGSRDDTLLHMSGVLATVFHHYTAEAIVAPLAAALDVEEDEPGWPTRALIAKLERDLVKAREKLVEVQQAPSAQVGGRVYTAEELAQWTKELGLSSPEELQRQLLVNVGSDFYVFWAGEYLWLGNKDRAEISMLSRLAAAAGPLPIVLGEETTKGFQTKTIKRLMMDYGVSLYKIEKDLRLQHSIVDKDADVFRFAICKKDSRLKPNRSHGVQLWLDSWNEPSLIDWCATAGRLDKPTAALILDGAPRTGKTQFAQAVASLWGHRPTPLRDLTASFNDSLTKCPVVYAEETIPWEYRRDTGLLKELVTADHQQLRQKYQDNATLAGALRVVIARNDHKLFEAGEALSKQTVDALSDRLLYVNTGSTPAPHFTSKEIAEHFLWLEENHQVRASDRGGMWVTGKPSRLHYRMRAFTSKISISLCQWLLNFIERPQFCGDTAGSLFRLDSTGLHVAPKLICDKWANYCANEHRQPTMAQVSEALAGVATRKGQLYKVDLDVLAEYADSVLSPWTTALDLQSQVERAGINAAQRAN